MAAPNSGVEATVPCFHGVGSPGHPEGRVQAVVPQGDRECRRSVRPGFRAQVAHILFTTFSDKSNCFYL